MFSLSGFTEKESEKETNVPREWNRLLGLGQIVWFIALSLTTRFACADTITFSDDDLVTPSVSATAARITTPACDPSTRISERCLGVIDHNPYTTGFGLLTATTLADYTLIYEGDNINTPLSDYLTRSSLRDSVSLNFTSDGTSENPLPLPSGLGAKPDLNGCFDRKITVNGNTVKCMKELERNQVAGRFAFTSAPTEMQANGTNTTVDTVQFHSDAEVPEPNSLLLLGSLVGALGIARHFRKGR